MIVISSEKREAMDCYDMVADSSLPSRPLPELRRDVNIATQWRLESRYTELAGVLPCLIPEITAAAINGASGQQRAAYSLLALAYRAADAIADKHGYHDMSARAVELTRWAVGRSEDPVLEMMAAYVRAELFFDGSHTRAGLRALDAAAGTMPPEGSTSGLAMYGALHMRAAVLAARMGMRSEAADRLSEARAAADRVPDGIYSGTAFGLSSVLVHELATAVEGGDIPRALQLATDWQPPPSLTAERRSHFHIEAASAFHWAGKPDRAINALWQARQAAPQHTRSNQAAIRTAQALLNARRKPPAPLLQLSAWFGLGA